MWTIIRPNVTPSRAAVRELAVCPWDYDGGPDRGATVLATWRADELTCVDMDEVDRALALTQARMVGQPEIVRWG